MKCKLTRYALLLAGSSLLSAIPATAATYTGYSPGNLIVFFQKEGGNQTVYADLGNAATLYRGAAAGVADGVNSFNIVNISASLNTAFGSSWASDTSIYAGLAGVWGGSASGFNNALQDGDPNRTLYVSSPRNSVGIAGEADSTGWDLSTAGNNSMTSGATGITVQNNVFGANSGGLQQLVVGTGLSQIDDMNPFFAPGLQDAAFQGAFAGGVQQRGTAGMFGTVAGVGTTEFALDLYRILGKTNAPGQVAGTNRVGSFEGTVLVGTDGNVSFSASEISAVPEPSGALALGLIGTVAGLGYRRRRSA